MIVINIAGVLTIALIVWWFWLYKPKEVLVTDAAEVIAVENGVYQPARIKLPAGKAASIQFLRKDASPCAAMVLIPQLNISEELPLDKVTTIALPALEKGEYAFHCQMQMYRGSLLIE